VNEFLQFSKDRRRLVFQQADQEMGLQAASVEKDFWVCWTLRELFAMPGIGEHLTFKGGTSLSKAWKLIKRFSEDIDLIVDKEIVGFGGAAAPDKAVSKNQRRARLEDLMDACREWVQGTLRPALADRLKAALGEIDWLLEIDPDVPDGQCLLFHFPSVFPRGTTGSVRPVVKIEVGARSDDWPNAERLIQPYVAELFPSLNLSAAFNVRVISAERTFWEKACLLHEESFRPADKLRKRGMARHYYDLWCLLKADVGRRAMADMPLFHRVAEHREIFFRLSWVDYTMHKPGTFRLVPPGDQIGKWRDDYKQMLGSMFFGDTPSFDELLAVLREFEQTFNETT
jgi:Nucleotidyl transferase AbiEii toxin, Type IV TA system